MSRLITKPLLSTGKILPIFFLQINFYQADKSIFFPSIQLCKELKYVLENLSITLACMETQCKLH